MYRQVEGAFMYPRGQFTLSDAAQFAKHMNELYTMFHVPYSIPSNASLVLSDQFFNDEVRLLSDRMHSYDYDLNHSILTHASARKLAVQAMNDAIATIFALPDLPDPDHLPPCTNAVIDKGFIIGSKNIWLFAIDLDLN